MMKYLPVSLVLLCLLTGCGTASPAMRRNGTDLLPAGARVWTEAMRSEERKNTYRVTIRMKNTAITGLCLLKKDGGGWKGTFINEFGARAFDFTVNPRQCELREVIAGMDRWYIRRTLASDLHFLFEIDHPQAPFRRKTTRVEEGQTLCVRYGRGKSVTRSPDGTLTLKNLSRDITYTLVPINE
ncbi:MAG: hypothetical protein LBT76_04090 [Tannerella sp.]|jgi:hypothetical protein|nr:hypothetical protein [Tannerella sp.]